MKCFNCGARMKRARYRFSDEYRGRPVHVEAEGVRCVKCAFQTVVAAQMAEYARAVADAYRREMRLLTSDEIRAARAALGMTQEQFAAFLGVGSASVKRWEWGHAQSAEEDRNLQQHINPEAFERDTSAAFWRVVTARHELTELPAIERLVPDTWAQDAAAIQADEKPFVCAVIEELTRLRHRGGVNTANARLGLVA